jgi:hypothetical protein
MLSTIPNHTMRFVAASVMGTRQPYQIKVAVENHNSNGVPLEESTIFSDAMRRDMFKHSFRAYTKLHRELYYQWQEDVVPHLAQVILYANNGAYDERQRIKNEESPFNDTAANIAQRQQEAERNKKEVKAKPKSAANAINDMFKEKVATGQITVVKKGSMLQTGERTRFDGKRFFSRRCAFEVAKRCAKNYSVHYTLRNTHNGMFGKP